MTTNVDFKDETPTFGNVLLPAVIDKQVKKLSKMQVDLMYSEMEADEFNEMSEMIGKLKEFMVNCRSYNGR
jgi:hypothetical protein